MRRCVIVGGADIVNYERVSAYVGEEDYVIYCDSGLKHRANLHRQPNLIVGDFDSHENPHLDIETMVLPYEKDDTDTVFVEDLFAYFSSINISGVIRKISIENVKYPLHNAEIQSGYQYGISHEVLPGKTAKITVGEGSALLIKVFK